MNITMCPFCALDSGGNHERGCPMNPTRIGKTMASTDSGPSTPSDTERLEWLMKYMAECGMAPRSRDYIDAAINGYQSLEHPVDPVLPV